MSYLNTTDSRMLNPLFRQGYRDMKRFGYDGLEMDMTEDYYAGVALAAMEIAAEDNERGDDLTWL
jgi:hypothetical protein